MTRCDEDDTDSRKYSRMAMAHIQNSVFFLLVIVILESRLTSGSVSDSISKYEIFNPEHLHHERLKRDLSTKEKSGHLLETSFLIKTSSQEFLLDLSLNRYLLHPKYEESYQNENGSEYKIKNDENCFYHGTVKGDVNTFVALSTCNGLRGIIHANNGEKYGVEPLIERDTEYLPTEDKHILFNMRDLKGHHAECGVNHTHREHGLDFKESLSHHMVRRSIGATEKKYVSTVFVVDKRLYEHFKENKTKVSLIVKEVANYVDGVYKTIGIRVAIVMLETWNIFDLIHVTGSAGNTLSEFQNYVGDVLSKKGYKQDNAQLLTGIDFVGSVVGMAGVGTICGLRSSGVNQYHSSKPAVVANTVAHEMGHNIGMHHNEDSCSCPNKPCVMDSVASYSPVKGFSSCSKSMLQRKIKDGVASCLFDSPTKLYGTPVCGNDFLEEGEECDCGTEEDCKKSGGSKCCDFKTCKLHPNADCAVGPCCSDCKYKSRGTLCRKEMTECDLSEYCTGKSHLCPGNFYKQDGTSCKGNKAYCFEGGCRTHDEQCEILWGSGTTMAEDICYNKLNQRANKYGNCGQDKREQYIGCAFKNTKCGKLHCKDMTRRFPIIGLTSSVSEVNYYIGSKRITCRSAALSLGKDLDDPSLVGQGTKCGVGQVCYNYTCTNITQLEFVKQCRYECKNGGICNSNGNCHCKAGYACPDCVESGPGGSSDSGQPCYVPSSGLSTTTMLIVFLVVVPLLLAIAAFFVYRYRDKIRARFRKGKTPKSSRFSKLNRETPGRPTNSGTSESKRPPISTPTNIVFQASGEDGSSTVLFEPTAPPKPQAPLQVKKPLPKPERPPPRMPPTAPPQQPTKPIHLPPKPPVQKRPGGNDVLTKPNEGVDKPSHPLPPIKTPGSKSQLPKWPPRPSQA